MATVIDSLLITLGLDAKGVSAGLGGIRGLVEEVGGAARNMTRDLTSMLVPLGAGFALKSIVTTFADTATELGKLSEKTRMSVQDLQAWGDAVEYAGGKASSVQNTLAALTRRFHLDLGRGGGRFKEAGDVLLRFADMAGRMDKRRFRRVAEAYGLDEDTIRLLSLGRDKVEELVTQFRTLAYTQADVEAARKFKRENVVLGANMRVVGAQISRAVLPVLMLFNKYITRAVTFLRQNEPFVKTVFAVLAGVLTAVFLPALLKCAAASALMMAPFLPLIGLVGILALLFEDLFTYLEDGESEFEDFWKAMGIGKETAEDLKKSWDAFKERFEKIWGEKAKENVKKFMDFVKGLLPYFAELLDGMLMAIDGFLNSSNEKMVDGLWKIAKHLTILAITIGAAILDMVFGVLRGIMDGLWNKLHNNAPEFVKKLFPKIGEDTPEKRKEREDAIKSGDYKRMVAAGIDKDNAASWRTGGSGREVVMAAMLKQSGVAAAPEKAPQAQTVDNSVTSNFGGVTINMVAPGPEDAARQIQTYIGNLATAANAATR